MLNVGTSDVLGGPGFEPRTTRVAVDPAFDDEGVHGESSAEEAREEAESNEQLRHFLCAFV